MKTAISVPDEVFLRAERLARQVRKSRSQLYSEAMAEYLGRHAPDEVTATLDSVLADLDGEPDPFVVAAGRGVLERSEW